MKFKEKKTFFSAMPLAKYLFACINSAKNVDFVAVILHLKQFKERRRDLRTYNYGRNPNIKIS